MTRQLQVHELHVDILSIPSAAGILVENLDDSSIINILDTLNDKQPRIEVEPNRVLIALQGQVAASSVSSQSMTCIGDETRIQSQINRNQDHVVGAATSILTDRSSDDEPTLPVPNRILASDKHGKVTETTIASEAGWIDFLDPSSIESETGAPYRRGLGAGQFGVSKQPCPHHRFQWAYHD